LDEEGFLFANLKEAGFQVYDCSLITIEKLVFTSPKFEFDWVFLASSNAAKIFLPSFSGKVKIAVVGSATAKAVTDLGFEVSFTGAGGNMAAVGKLFAKETRSSPVLFPCAEEGSKKIQHQLHEDQVIDLPIYRSVAKQDIVIPETSIVFLSSPSNAKIYLDHINPGNKTIVAIGETTREFLTEKGILNVLVPKSPELDSILDLILGL
jgi:uroporphyrinogen-III synthase